MFIRPDSKEEASNIKPNFTIVSAPHFKADLKLMELNQKLFVIFIQT